MRIGNSFDFHPFIKGKPLMLGGIEIEYEKGLEAISDGDALIHAISEAILGALALGDLGTFFKEEDSLGMDSKLILSKVIDMMEFNKYRIVNIDSMIIAEEPKMHPYIIRMRETLSYIMGIDVSQISIKATTMEKRGIIGSKEGIACFASVLLEEDLWII